MWLLPCVSAADFAAEACCRGSSFAAWRNAKQCQAVPRLQGSAPKNPQRVALGLGVHGRCESSNLHLEGLMRGAKLHREKQPFAIKGLVGDVEKVPGDNPPEVGEHLPSKSKMLKQDGNKQEAAAALASRTVQMHCMTMTRRTRKRIADLSFQEACNTVS